jgi:hypothetical protein
MHIAKIGLKSLDASYYKYHIKFLYIHNVLMQSFVYHEYECFWIGTESPGFDTYLQGS